MVKLRVSKRNLEDIEFLESALEGLKASELLPRWAYSNYEFLKINTRRNRLENKIAKLRRLEADN